MHRTRAFTRAALIIALAPTPVLAIPSPDVVVNFFANAAQTLGLLSVVLGGTFVSKRRRTDAGRRGRVHGATFVVVCSLFAISLVANVLQYASASDSNAVRLSRNLLRPSVEEGRRVGDVSLRELSYSGQLEHPQGISTEDLDLRLRGDSGGVALFDVRESEEVEAGRIPGARAIRYPDLQLDPSPIRGTDREVILLCYSGNRSSELAQEFAEVQGIAPRFLIGGYEKWIAESRPLEVANGRRSSELRELPRFPQRDRLLDTPEVERLVADRSAIFVDVRYPGDFDLWHLPGAVNVPLRKLTSPEIDRALAALPEGPIIAPCYDKRSSFYALILGVRVHRSGREFLGRYSVPHEFAARTSEREHARKFLEEKDRGVLATLLVRPLDRSLRALASSIGHLGWAIVGAVIILRLFLLPITLKSERDRRVLAGLEGELDELRVRAGEDRARYSRGVLSLHRRHGIRSGLNLAGTAFQLVLFVAFFAAVNGVAGTTSPAVARTSMGWIDSLADPDPALVLPAILGLLIWLTVESTARRGGGWRRAGRVGIGLFLFAITYRLSAAVNLYLAFNVGLLLAQNSLTSWVAARSVSGSSVGADARIARVGKTLPFPPLALAHLVPSTGNKARRLGELIEAGFPVPDGFAVTAERVVRAEPLDAEEWRAVDAHWKRIRAERVAVRSSGLNEDGEEQSYAGMFDSILDVERAAFGDALVAVGASLDAARAKAYAGREESGGVVVQKMVPAEYAGVLFTEHPSESGSLLVELVRGLGEGLVSGAKTPDAFRIGRLSRRLLDGEVCPIDLAPLVDLGLRIEALYGRPQDIEWAFAHGRFWILQTRDITACSTSDHGVGRTGTIERERRRLLRAAATGGARSPDDVLLIQNELSELLPRPTPLSLSLMRRLWESGGSTDLACRELGVPYHVEEHGVPYVETVFGALYVNEAEGRRRVGRGPGTMAAFRLMRSAERIERSFRDEFLPRFETDMTLRETMNLRLLDLPHLADILRETSNRFVTETYVEAEIVNVAAGFYLDSAVRALERRGVEPAAFLADIPETVVHRAMEILPKVRTGECSRRDFLALFGHRAPYDWELAQPRYREDRALVGSLIDRAQVPSLPDGTDARAASSAHRLGSRVVRLAVDRALRFQALKEEAKHHTLRQLAFLREILLALDDVLGLDGRIFWLELGELEALVAADSASASNRDALRDARTRIAQRRACAAHFEDLDLPTRLRVADLESLDIHGGRSTSSEGTWGSLQGVPAAGDRPVTGIARVIADARDIDTFRDGEILVARFTDPAWTPLFPRAAGVVTEVGGRLSHAAIVAREYGTMAIVGVEGATRSIRTGDILELHPNGRIAHLHDRRSSSRRSVEIPVVVRSNMDASTPDDAVATIRDLSHSGALVDMSAAIEVGDLVRLCAKDFAVDGIEARIVRRHASGRYALHFSEPCDLWFARGPGPTPSG